MAPSKTTTLRLPQELRNDIARIAERRGTTMIDVVSDAVHRLGRDEWWESVHDALNVMTPSEVSTYLVETKALEDAAADGLDGR